MNMGEVFFTNKLNYFLNVLGRLVLIAVGIKGSGVSGKLAYHISFHLGRNDEIRQRTFSYQLLKK